MTSILGVKKIQYPNGTNAVTVGTDGVLTFDKKIVSASTDSSTFAGKIMANAGITAYGQNATGVSAAILITDEHSNEVTFGTTNAGHLAVRNYNSNADIYFSDDSNNVNLRLYNDGTLKGMSEGGGGLNVNFTQGSLKHWSSIVQAGTQAILDSYNCASATDDGTARTTVTFTNNMNNSVYSATCTQKDGSGYNDDFGMHSDNADAYSTSQFGYYCHATSTPNDAGTAAWCQIAGDIA